MSDESGWHGGSGVGLEWVALYNNGPPLCRPISCVGPSKSTWASLVVQERHAQWDMSAYAR